MTTTLNPGEVLPKRNIWIPNMRVSRLKKLLGQTEHTADDIEDLRDFKYFLLTDQQSAAEKGFMVQLQVDGREPVYRIKDAYWLTNIDHAIETGMTRLAVVESPAN